MDNRRYDFSRAGPKRLKSSLLNPSDYGWHDNIMLIGECDHD